MIHLKEILNDKNDFFALFPQNKKLFEKSIYSIRMSTLFTFCVLFSSNHKFDKQNINFLIKSLLKRY